MEPTATQRSVNVVTEVPGPRSRAILERKNAAVASCMSIYMPVATERADGALLTDVDGNTFIDWTGGVGCLNVGHANPRVVEAVKRQAERFTHTDFTIVMYENYIELAERLGATVPISGPVKASFFNAGAEAVENAVKVAKAATGRSAVIAFDRAFHGRTLLAMSMTSRVHPYKAGFGPFASEVYRMPYPKVGGSGFGVPADDGSAEAALAALRHGLTAQVAPESVAAIVLEPIQGEGGFIVPPREFLAGVREICDEHGIVMVADEVQTGMGRTGTMWAMEHYGIEPDILLSAKSIASGLPLSAVFGKAPLMDAVPDGGMGGTYVGNPVAIAAALAVLDELEDGMLERAVAIGERMQQGFADVAASTDAISAVRGVGPMVALEFSRDGMPAGDIAGAVAREAANRGLILMQAGISGEVIRTLVPFAITDEQVDESLGILAAAVDAAC